MSDIQFVKVGFRIYIDLLDLLRNLDEVPEDVSKEEMIKHIKTELSKINGDVE